MFLSYSGYIRGSSGIYIASLSSLQFHVPINVGAVAVAITDDADDVDVDVVPVVVLVVGYVAAVITVVVVIQIAHSKSFHQLVTYLGRNISLDVRPIVLIKRKVQFQIHCKRRFNLVKQLRN